MAKTTAIIEASIAKLGGIEKEAKALIGELAIDTVAHLHVNGQAGICNKLLLVLSPANKKAVLSFFREFTGFVVDNEEGVKTKIKDGDKYANAEIAFNEFVEGGHSFWLWWAATQKKDKPVEAPLDLAKLTDTVKKAAKKAGKQGISRTALFNAVITDVFSPDEILELLDAALATADAAPAAKAGK